MEGFLKHIGLLRMNPSWCESDKPLSKGQTSKENPATHSAQCWSAYVDRSGSLLTKIHGLFNNNEMSDVTLSVGGKEYPAHRLVLCTFSEVFQELTDACLEYMSFTIAQAAVNNLLVSWLQYTQNCGHVKTAQACQNFVKWNFAMVANTPDFGNFEPDTLICLLQQNDLVIHDELELFKLVVAWLDLQQQRLILEGGEEDLESTMTALTFATMKHIRFPMMSPRQLAELLLSPLTQKYKDFFVQRMALGMAFHSGKTESMQEALNDPDGCSLFMPRLYTADTWSAVLSVENYSNVQPYHARTLVFNSPRSCAEFKGEKSCEWVVDLYPRGVWFRKCLLIVWQGTMEVPEAVFRSVRLTISCKEPEDDLRVKVGVLVYSSKENVEHIGFVTERIHYFDTNGRVLNFDNLLPYEEIEKYLIGPNHDTIKMHIIIAPLCDLRPKNNVHA